MSLWATKSIAALRAEADAQGERTLKRTLGPFNLVTLGIGAIIGAGIFVLTGQAAALHAGPAVPISMALVVVVGTLAFLVPNGFPWDRWVGWPLVVGLFLYLIWGIVDAFRWSATRRQRYAA